MLSYLAFFTWIHFVLHANVELANRQNVLDFLECGVFDAQFFFQLAPFLSGLLTIDVGRIYADPSKIKNIYDYSLLLENWHTKNTIKLGMFVIN